jgi:hypothetical protein
MDKPAKPRLSLIHSWGASANGCSPAAAKRRVEATSKRMFVEVGDGRSAWAVRWKGLILAHANDLGGPEMLSEAQISICRRSAAIECELEAMEGRMSAGQPLDVSQYARLTGVLCRLLELVGIKGRAKPLDPQSELIKALAPYAGMPIDDADDEDEPLPIEEGQS